MRRHLILASAAFLALTGVACTDDKNETAAPSGTIKDTAAAPAESTTTTVAAAPAKARIVLAPDGLEVVDFGAAASDAIREITAVLGPEDGDVEEDLFRCAVDIQTDHQWRNLRIHVRNGKFVAWSDSAAPQPGMDETHDLRTPEGLKTGNYVSALRKAYPTAEISKGEDIPGHFSVRSAPGKPRHLWGYLTGTGDNDLVDTIFGGDCGPDPTL